MTRKQFLNEAEKIITVDREKQYGTPENSFTVIAELWNAYDKCKTKQADTAEDVAIKMALLKIARIITGEVKNDNYIDLIGYSACAGEIATKMDNPPLTLEQLEKMDGLKVWVVNNLHGYKPKWCTVDVEMQHLVDDDGFFSGFGYISDGVTFAYKYEVIECSPK